MADDELLFWTTKTDVPRKLLCEALAEVKSLLNASPLFTITLTYHESNITQLPMLTHMAMGDDDVPGSRWAFGMGLSFTDSVWGGLNNNGDGASVIKKCHGFIPMAIFGFLYKNYFYEEIMLAIDGSTSIERLLYKDIINICPEYKTDDNFDIAVLLGLAQQPFLSTIKSNNDFAF